MTVKKITPASVREFLRRSQGGSHADMGRGVVEFFGGGGGGGGGGASSSSGQSGYSGGGSGGNGHQRHSPRSGTAGSAPPPDTELLLELLEFCLSDCSLPAGDRPPEVPTAAATAGGGGEVAGAGARAAGGGQGQGQGTAADGGGCDEDGVEAAAWNSREALEARQVSV